MCGGVWGGARWPPILFFCNNGCKKRKKRRNAPLCVFFAAMATKGRKNYAHPYVLFHSIHYSRSEKGIVMPLFVFFFIALVVTRGKGGGGFNAPLCLFSHHLLQQKDKKGR